MPFMSSGMASITGGVANNRRIRSATRPRVPAPANASSRTACACQKTPGRQDPVTPNPSLSASPFCADKRVEKLSGPVLGIDNLRLRKRGSNASPRCLRCLDKDDSSYVARCAPSARSGIRPRGNGIVISQIWNGRYRLSPSFASGLLYISWTYLRSLGTHVFGVYRVNLWLVRVDNRTSNRLLVRYALSPILFPLRGGQKIRAGSSREQSAAGFHSTTTVPGRFTKVVRRGQITPLFLGGRYNGGPCIGYRPECGGAPEDIQGAFNRAPGGVGVLCLACGK